MWPTISKPWVVYIPSLAGIVLATIVFFVLTPDSSSRASGTKSVAAVKNQTIPNLNSNTSVESVSLPTKPSPGLPLRLKIPKINVDAAVDYVGRTPAGAMDVPKGPSTVAWFNLGPRPGEIGSAVMAGHYGWYNSLPAAFDRLHRLQPGDTVSVEDDQGATTTFVVRQLRTYGQQEGATEVFSSSDGIVHLNLVTCTGVWNKAKKSYSQRLVIFTDQE